MNDETSLSALRAILAAAARAPASADTLVTIAEALRQAVDASAVSGELTSAGGEGRRWNTGGRGPEAVGAIHSFPLSTGDGIIGVLRVQRQRALTAHESMLTTAVGDLLVTTATREGRVRALQQEITARVREVAEQRVFIECVVDSLPFGLYVVDREYRIHAWNHKRETGLQGVARTDAIGRTIFEVLHRQPATMLKTEFDEVFATGRLQQFQMESNAFGDTRTFRISKIPMRMAGDAVSHVITVGEDITDWRAAIDRTAQSEKLAALGQLAAGVMHEINNPLATIAACAESIALHRELAEGLPPGALVPGANPAEMLRIIDLEVQRCKRIINGLLDFARPKPAHREAIDLNSVVQQGLFLVQHHPRYKRVKMVTDLETTRPLLLEGDADQLVQVLIALAMNAIDATPEGGRITIRTMSMRAGVGDAQVALEVADEGPGIPRALQAKVFEPFFTTKPQGQGTGLGLAICYGIINDHAGQLELVSGDAPGAVFRVVLPEVSMRSGAVQ